MKAIIITAVIAVCSAAKLDRSYLPPASAKTAGGTSEILQTPKGSTFLPVGSYENEHQGVVVDAALNTRASNIVQSGLGAPRITYGSTDSRVGEAAFRDKHLQGAPSFLPPGFDGFVQRPERIQANRDRLSNTIRLENNIGPNMYNYLFETENGIRAGQKAVSVNGIRAEGGYSYTGDDGLVYTVTYTADEDGYQPKGSHLPTPPPIPVEILKALEQNAKDEAAGVVDDGSYDAKKYNSEGDYSDNGDNDKYNDRQSNTFANRPEFDAQSSGSFNQNQALSPNANDQSGFVGNFKDQPSQFNIQTPDAAAGFSGNQPNEASNQGFIAQPSSYNSPTSDRFGQSSKPEQPGKEYLPPNYQPFSQQGLNQNPIVPTTTSVPSITHESGVPLFQQNLQNIDRPDSLSSRPSSYEATSTGQVSSDSRTDPNPQGGDGKTNSQNNFSSYFPPVPSQTFSQTTGNFVKQPNVSNRFEIQQTIVPTNQPSRDLTTPFVSFPPLDKVTSNINNQITSTNQPTTYDGQVYQYNKPATIKQEPQNGNKQPSFGSFKPLEQNKPEANKHQQISTGNNGGEIYEYNKPATSQQTGISSQDFNKKPEDSIQQFAVNQPLQGNTNGEVYQYNKPTLPQTSSTINSVNNERPLQGSEMNQSQTITQLIANVFGEQNQFNEPIESEKKQQIKESEIYEYNKPTSVPNLNVQQPTTSLGNNNAEGQPQNYIFSPNQNKNSSPGTYQQPSSVLQSTQTRPTNPSFFPNSVASRFSEAGPSGTQGSSLQQPTTPSFSQITQNVYSQPQGPDNSYFYDKPSKPFRQQFPQSPFNTNSAQRPNVDQSQSLVVNRFNTPSLPLASTSIQSANQLQNNGITQAPTSLASSLTTKPTNQQNNLPSLQTFNPYTQTSQQPGSFANAFASTQSFPTLKPQEQTTFNRPEAEIYEYNKPAGSLPESENNNEQKIETPNGQLRPQTVISVDNSQGSQTQNTREPVAIQEQSFESPIPDASIGLQSNPSSRPLGSTIIGSPCCKSFQKNQMQVNAVPKPNFNTQAIRQENQREQFDVNRKPPTYDSTGYHY